MKEMFSLDEKLGMVEVRHVIIRDHVVAPDGTPGIASRFRVLIFWCDTIQAADFKDWAQSVDAVKRVACEILETNNYRCLFTLEYIIDGVSDLAKALKG
jgi:hypothetical protein